MFYYHVWVRSTGYRSHEPLTYNHQNKLKPGSLVIVPLKNLEVLAIVGATVKKPKFTTKTIVKVFDLPQLPLETSRLFQWLSLFYPAPVGITVQQFLPKVINTDQYQNPVSINQLPNSPIKQPVLTADQIMAINKIKKPDTYLLHGRTGSGKTRIYTELAKKCLKLGQSVLILSPEIGLTSQLADSFSQLTTNQVVVLHSQLTAKEHNRAWLTILLAKEPLIIIGPRSALFSPIKNLGLIIVDECHDPSYKQEKLPYYQTVRVASQLSQIHNAILVFGSATPSVADYYLAKIKNKAIIKLDTLAVPNSFQRQVIVVDIKDHSQFSRSPHLSLPLIQAMTKSLSNNEQILLYLNRRGTARVTLCQNCGWQATCPHCDLPLTYHGDSHKLLCHICGFSQSPIISCPNCGNTEITLQSFGTKAIVDETQRLFPEARIMRFDSDNIKAERLENQYHKIINGEVDILIGTQILSKGLDLPRLSTLGVILADSSLYIPDFTAQERTYQLLTQVLGRIGRGHLNSQAIIQTYNPNSPLLQSSLDNDWQKFYELEINQRQQYNFPPFCHLLKLTCHRASATSAQKATLSFKKLLKNKSLKIVIEGPAPAFYEKLGNKFYWQLIVKSQNRADLLTITKLLPTNGWSYDLDPANLL